MAHVEPLHQLLIRAARAADRRLTEDASGLALTSARERLLRAFPAEGVTTASVLAAELGVHRSTVLRGLRRLEQAGWLEALEPHPADRRIRLVRLSAEGRAVNWCVAVAPDPLGVLLAPHLDADGQAALRRALDLVASL